MKDSNNSIDLEDLKEQMLSSIDKLKNEITYKKIYQDYHIHISVLESIEEMNFEKFVPSTTRANGFINMLEKHYGVNLEYWLIEYNKYIDSIKDSKIDSESKIKEQNLKALESSKPKQVNSRSSINKASTSGNKNIFSKQNINILAGVTIVILLIIFLISNSNKSDKVIDDNSTDSIVEAKTLLNEVNKTSLQDSSTNLKISYTDEIKKESETVSSDNKLSSTNSIDTKEKLELDESKPKEETIETLIKNGSIIASNEIKINPRTKLWLGVIELDNYKKVGLTIPASGKTLEIKDNTLLLSGHGIADIEIDGEKMSFNSQTSLRFLYKNGELKKITKSEFTKLNRGKSW